MASEQIAENANCPTGAEIAQVGRQFDGEGLTIAYMMGVADEKARGRAAVAELVEAAQVFSLIVRDEVPDDELVDCIAWTARDFRKLAKALSRHQENSNG